MPSPNLVESNSIRMTEDSTSCIPGRRNACPVSLIVTDHVWSQGSGAHSTAPHQSAELAFRHESGYGLLAACREVGAAITMSARQHTLYALPKALVLGLKSMELRLIVTPHDRVPQLNGVCVPDRLRLPAERCDVLSVCAENAVAAGH